VSPHSGIAADPVGNDAATFRGREPVLPQEAAPGSPAALLRSTSQDAPALVWRLDSQDHLDPLTVAIAALNVARLNVAPCRRLGVLPSFSPEVLPCLLHTNMVADPLRSNDHRSKSKTAAWLSKGTRRRKIWGATTDGSGTKKPALTWACGLCWIPLDADLAPWAGLEPATSRLGGGRSIHLSYQGVLAGGTMRCGVCHRAESQV
jgi:hypothetical protein